MKRVVANTTLFFLAPTYFAENEGWGFSFAATDITTKVSIDHFTFAGKTKSDTHVAVVTIDSFRDGEKVGGLSG